MTRLPTSLRLSLYNFLNEAATHAAFTDVNGDALPFDLTFFLAEALLSADDNDLASERAGHYDFPGLACMFERLDEHLDMHRTASEVRQSNANTCFDSPESRILSDEVFAWFDAPEHEHVRYRGDIGTVPSGAGL